LPLPRPACEREPAAEFGDGDNDTFDAVREVGSADSNRHGDLDHGNDGSSGDDDNGSSGDDDDNDSNNDDDDEDIGDDGDGYDGNPLGCGARRGIGMTDTEALSPPSPPATVHIQRSQSDSSDAANDVVKITASDSPDNIAARGELCELLDNMIAERLDNQEAGDEGGNAASRPTVNPHVEVPGRGVVSKHTLVLELNKKKSVGKNGDALAKLDTARLRRVKQASRDGAERASRETVDALVSTRVDSLMILWGGG
jgi:hypothetical protein